LPEDADSAGAAHTSQAGGAVGSGALPAERRLAMLKALTIVIFAELGVMIAAAAFAVIVGIVRRPNRVGKLREGSS
jgi:hypothetical protein